MHVDGDGCANPAHFHFSDIGKPAVALCHISNGACGTVWEASVGHHVLLHCGKLALSESVACLSVCLGRSDTMHSMMVAVNILRTA